MNYSVLKNNIHSLDDYEIRPISIDDLELIRQWRNEQKTILRQNVVLTKEMQVHYYKTAIAPLFRSSSPKQILFSFFHNNTLIGYGGLVHISWIDKRAEMSFLVNTNRTLDRVIYCNDFSCFIKLMSKVCFEELGLNRLFTETYAFRDYHISILEANGFNYEGCLKNHVYIDGKYYNSLIHGLLREGNCAE